MASNKVLIQSELNSIILRFSQNSFEDTEKIKELLKELLGLDKDHCSISLQFDLISDAMNQNGLGEWTKLLKELIEKEKLAMNCITNKDSKLGKLLFNEMLQAYLKKLSQTWNLKQIATIREWIEQRGILNVKNSNEFFSFLDALFKEETMTLWMNFCFHYWDSQLFILLLNGLTGSSKIKVLQLGSLMLIKRDSKWVDHTIISSSFSWKSEDDTCPKAVGKLTNLVVDLLEEDYR